MQLNKWLEEALVQKLGLATRYSMFCAGEYRFKSIGWRPVSSLGLSDVFRPRGIKNGAMTFFRSFAPLPLEQIGSNHATFRDSESLYLGGFAVPRCLKRHRPAQSGVRVSYPWGRQLQATTGT